MTTKTGCSILISHVSQVDSGSGQVDQTNVIMLCRLRDRHIILFNFPIILFFNSFILPYYSFPLFSFSPYYSFHLSLSHM